jgi:cyclic pyranopterin phosphate synthase
MNLFSHLDENGDARMVDISGKDITARIAVATGKIKMSPECFTMLLGGTIPKGDVLSTARIAGIMAAKKTSDLIPMCHTLMLEKVKISFEPDEDAYEIKAVCEVRLTGKTGAEMEALTGVSVALLTVYDMCKAVDRRMEIGKICLLSKHGGKSGDFVRE